MVFNVNVIFRLQTRRIRNQDATSIRLMDGLILKFEVYRNTFTAALGNVRCVMCDGCCQSLVPRTSTVQWCCTLTLVAGMHTEVLVLYNPDPVQLYSSTSVPGMYMHSALLMIVTEVTVPEFSLTQSVQERGTA